MFSILNLKFIWNISTLYISILALALLVSSIFSIYKASVGKHYRTGIYYLLLIFIYPMTFILLFASFYQSSLAKFNISITEEWFDPIYFSIVTWTTLGYGDYQPCNFSTKFITSLEGFIGYLFSGIIIIMIFNVINKIDIINTK